MTDQQSNLTTVQTLVDALSELESEERQRVIKAALALLGEHQPLGPEQAVGVESNAGRSPESMKETRTAYEYINSKKPRTKGEEIAVAARYLEEFEGLESTSRIDIERVVRAARRDFDAHNFNRDLDNARRRGLFNSGTGRDNLVLSHYGQQYVDCLPERDAIKQLSAPRKVTNKRKKRATASKKKVSSR